MPIPEPKLAEAVRASLNEQIEEIAETAQSEDNSETKKSPDETIQHKREHLIHSSTTTRQKRTNRKQSHSTILSKIFQRRNTKRLSENRQQP